MKKLLVVAALFLASNSRAQIFPRPDNSNDGNSYSGNLVNFSSGLAYSAVATLDLAKYDSSKVSAQVILSTVSPVNTLFSDGSQSTGSAQINIPAALSTAAATNRVTIVSTSGLSGAVLNVNGNLLRAGVEWFVASTASGTARSLALAISALPNLSAANANAVVFATAAVGSYANAYGITSNNSSMTVRTLFMTGGQDNAILRINGTSLTANSQWFPMPTSSATATSLAAAINAATALKLRASASNALVTSTSIYNGTTYNYSLAFTVPTSTPTAVTLSGANMTGGTNPQDTLGSRLLTSSVPVTLPLALPLLYTGSPAIGGLVAGTTYFAVPVTAYSYSLAKYSTSAIAGLTSDFALVTSTNSGITANTYTLAPLPWTSGNATFTWQSSNDGANWFTAASTGTVTITPNGSPADMPIDFGSYNYRYLRLNYVAPGTGAVNLTVPMNIKQDGIGRF